jgi:membrane protease YdiL (CAAX protease family)
MVERPRLDLIGMLALLVAVNVLTVVVLDGWASALLQVVAAGGAVAIAFSRDYSADDLALSSRSLGAGVRLGMITAAIIAAGVALIAIVPFSRSFLDDDRFADIAGSEIVYQVGLRIPLITALTEELLFRAVLLAILLQLLSVRWAVVGSAGVFGLWHVLTTIGDLDGNEATESLSAIGQVGSVAAVVVATGAAGLLFGWLRVRSGSVIAPWFAHIAFNAGTFVAGVIVVGRGWV